MVGNVSGRRERPDSRKRVTLTVGPGPNRARRHRQHLAPELVVRLAERLPGARDEPIRLRHVGGPITVHVDRQSGVFRQQVAAHTRVVEVNVGQEHVAKVRKRQTEVGQAGPQGLESGARSGIHQGRLGIVDQVGGDRPPEAEVQQVDRRDAQPRSSIGTKSRTSLPT